MRYGRRRNECEAGYKPCRLYQPPTVEAVDPLEDGLPALLDEPLKGGLLRRLGLRRQRRDRPPKKDPDCPRERPPRKDRRGRGRK